MPDWSVMIVPASGKPGVNAAFQPDIKGAKPGQPLRVVQYDNVSWNNTTDKPRWPWLLSDANAAPADPPPNGVYLTPAQIEPRTPSPIFTVTADTGTTLYYCDKLNPAVRGQIDVVAFGA